MYAYSKLFNHLTQYALEQVDTDEKKKYWFMNGLSTKLQERFALNANWTFLELVSNTIIVDDAIWAHQESKKKKVLATPFDSAPHKYQMVYAPHCNPQQQHHHQLATYPPPYQIVMPRAVTPPLTVLHTSSQKRGIVPQTCYNYGQVGHFAKECMSPRQIDVPHPLGNYSHLSGVVAAKTDQLNYTTMEAIPEGELVLVGTFFLNGHPIIILFDSGATHDFISKACTQKHQLPIAHTHTPYRISTPGGNILTK
jgi:hypothetical protein